jgi:ribose-phosphate pyrophosphokinase
MIKVNKHIIDPTKFPDGTSQVWKNHWELIDNEKLIYEIVWDFENEGELIFLAQLAYYIRNTRYMCGATMNLKMPFLPYGRQDKAVSNLSTYALYPFLEIINSMQFNKVITIDAHSDVFGERTYNAENVFPEVEIKSALSLSKSEVVAYPDAGAVKRYSAKLAEEYIEGAKERDQLTGMITDYKVVQNEHVFKGKKLLIVDDICDGGMTFKIFAEKLLDSGAAEVNLYVSHGIFSKGLETLRGSGINRIFTHKGEV